ncbi:MAG: AraC family transcriptional regulator [Clostridiales bacterium]|nr:AraC family transcriptional regulator [Clostridiales bacterium]
MNKVGLKEDMVHGTVKFPLAVYWQKTDERFTVKLHWHEETEIIFLVSGRFSVDINMKKYKLQGPAILFIGSGDIHSIVGEPGCRENAVVFDMKMLSFEYLDGVQLQIIRPLLEKSMQFPQIVTKKDGIWDELKRLYEAVLLESEKENPASRMKVKAYLYEILAYLHESGSFINMENTGDYNSEKINNIKKVLGFIHENFNRRITGKDMAELLGINEQYFCRYFKKVTGKTPTMYVNEVRIEKAAGYLQQTDRKIIDIAMECGYDNIGYFIKRFKEQKGLSPSEYRAKCQNNVIKGQNR